MIRKCIVCAVVVAVPWTCIVDAQGEDAPDIAELEQSVADSAKERTELVAKVGAFALDGTQKAVDRRRAFGLIAAVGGPEAAKLLAKNVNLLVPTSIDGDVDMVWQWPAREALATMGWHGVPALLDELSTATLDDKDLRRHANLLERMCGRDVAAAAIRGHKSVASEWPHNQERLVRAVEAR